MSTGSSALASFGGALNVAVVGASGGIGGAFVEALSADAAVARVLAFSRRAPGALPAKAMGAAIDLESESTIAAAAARARALDGGLHLVVVATGLLHDGPDLQPEKTWRALDADAMTRAFRVNAAGPALVAKHFLPLLAQGRKTAFAALSARVGSISDNRLGGWHAYRASKAALNMLIRTLAIELAYRNPSAFCVGLHPGTVDTALSAPFQGSVTPGKLSTAAVAAAQLLGVLDGLDADASGRVFDWAGDEIAA